MSEWKEHNITEVCNTISDTYRDGANKVVLINTSDVLEGKITNHELVPNKNLAGQFKKKFQKNDILYSEIRPANRRYAYVDFDPKDYIASTKLMVLRSKPCILPKYLYYLLTNNETIRNLHAIAIGRSGTFPQITYSELANIKFLLPSIKEQEKILSILLDLDDKIAVNRRICENLEAQAQALFKHWFIDFVPFKDGKFIETELGMIPEGWRVGKLEEFVSIKRGGSPRPIHKFISDKGVNWLKISDATSSNSPFIFDIKEHIIEEGLSKTVFLKAGELVLSNSATPCVPRFLCVDSCIHDGWLYFINSQLPYEYLYLLFVNMRKHLLAQANGSVFLNLKTDIVKAQEIIYPGIRIMDDFNKMIYPLFQSMKTLYAESIRLSTLRDTLLPKLMSGQIKL